MACFAMYTKVKKSLNAGVSHHLHYTTHTCSCFSSRYPSLAFFSLLVTWRLVSGLHPGLSTWSFCRCVGECLRQPACMRALINNISFTEVYFICVYICVYIISVCLCIYNVCVCMQICMYAFIMYIYIIYIKYICIAPVSSLLEGVVYKSLNE